MSESNTGFSPGPEAKDYKPPRELHVNMPKIFATVAVCLTVVAVLFWVKTRITAAIETANDAVCKSNLKQIGKALLDYHRDHGAFPPAHVMGEDGKPMHSWRVLILPYLGYDDLFERYDMSEPWDGPHNKKLYDEMPDVYLCPSSADKGSIITCYVAVLGDASFWRDEGQTRLVDPSAPPPDKIMVLEIHNVGFIWSQPEDHRDRTLEGEASSGSGLTYLSAHPYTINSVMADGTVRSWDVVPDPSELRKAFRAGSAVEVVAAEQNDDSS